MAIQSVCMLRAHAFFSDGKQRVDAYSRVPVSRIARALWEQPASASHEFLAHLFDSYASVSDDFKSQLHMVHHAREMNRIFSHLYVDELLNVIIYLSYGGSKSGYTPIISYWKSRGHYEYLRLYLWYADALSYIIVNHLQNTALHIEEQDAKDYITRVQIYLNDLKDVMPLFTGTRYEEMYAYAIRRYKNMFSLLESRINRS